MSYPEGRGGVMSEAGEIVHAQAHERFPLRRETIQRIDFVECATEIASEDAVVPRSGPRRHVEGGPPRIIRAADGAIDRTKQGPVFRPHGEELARIQNDIAFRRPACGDYPVRKRMEMRHPDIFWRPHFAGGRLNTARTIEGRVPNDEGRMRLRLFDQIDEGVHVQTLGSNATDDAKCRVELIECQFPAVDLSTACRKRHFDFAEIRRALGGWRYGHDFTDQRPSFGIENAQDRGELAEPSRSVGSAGDN